MHYSFKSTPTWTFPGRPKTAGTSYPGPADYNSRKPLPRSASVSAVTQQRNLYKQFDANPGPGAYNSKSCIGEGPKRSMSARTLDYTKPTPGPHEYDSNTLKVKGKAPNYSMSTRSKSYHQLTFDNNVYSPSPTAYKQKEGFDKKNGTFIGTSTRKDLTETQKTPGPNHYMSQKAGDYTAKNNPKCAIGGELRKTTQFANTEKTPGPAMYDKKSLFDNNKEKNKGYSCRNKTADLIALQMSKYPGPGMYNSSLYTKPNAPRCAGTQNPRTTFMDDMQSSKKQYPGPGKHDPGFNSSKYRSASAYDFGNSTRRPLDQNEKTPGPVHYRNDKHQVMNSAPKFSVTKTIAKNQFLGVSPGTPGPGYYDPGMGLIKHSSSTYQIGREKRPDFDKHKYTPGPGYYNLRGKHSGGWSFTKQQRIAFTDKKSDAKHGTHYEIPQKVVDPPKYMNVQSKIKYESPYKTGFSTMNSASKSPQKTR